MHNNHYFDDHLFGEIDDHEDHDNDHDSGYGGQRSFSPASRSAPDGYEFPTGGEVRNPARIEPSASGLPSPEMTNDLDLSFCDSFLSSPTLAPIGHVSAWLEVFDYVGGNRFRGFVAEKRDTHSSSSSRSMFIFFDEAVIGGDLKAGLMALLELCELAEFQCERLVVCLDRGAEPGALEALAKDLGWIGFQLATLVEFAEGLACPEIVSERWLFMEMDV